MQKEGAQPVCLTKIFIVGGSWVSGAYPFTSFAEFFASLSA